MTSNSLAVRVTRPQGWGLDNVARSFIGIFSTSSCHKWPGWSCRRTTVCVHVCVCVRVRACVRVCVWTDDQFSLAFSGQYMVRSESKKIQTSRKWQAADSSGRIKWERIYTVGPNLYMTYFLNEQWWLQSRKLAFHEYLQCRVSDRLFCRSRYFYKWYSRPWHWHVIHQMISYQCILSTLASAASRWSHRKICDLLKDAYIYCQWNTSYNTSYLWLLNVCLR